jgi:hypothetical protein
MCLSLLPAASFKIPSFPSYSKLPVDHPDVYARSQGLITDFDRKSWTMSEEQCDAAFNPLWLPLYESKKLTESQGGHSLKRQEKLEKQESEPHRLMCHKIINNTLYLSQFNHMEHGSRVEAAAMLLERAIATSPERLPDV